MTYDELVASGAVTIENPDPGLRLAQGQEDGKVRSERIFVIDCRGATGYNLTVLSRRHAADYEMGLENGKR